MCQKCTYIHAHLLVVILSGTYMCNHSCVHVYPFLLCIDHNSIQQCQHKVHIYIYTCTCLCGCGYHLLVSFSMILWNVKNEADYQICKCICLVWQIFIGIMVIISNKLCTLVFHVVFRCNPLFIIVFELEWEPCNMYLYVHVHCLS